jgi:predicted MFS family arabinose efflux permease
MDLKSAAIEHSSEAAQVAAPSDTLFRHRDFMRLWTGETISQFGSKISTVAISFLAVIGLHATPAQMGALTVWRTAPALLFSLFAGAWVDRLRRRPLMIASDIANIVLLGSIPLAAAMHTLRIEQVYLVIFLAAFADILFGVAYQAYLPTLVGRDAIARANSILAATEAAAETGAFGLAGWLVQWLTAPIAILFDSISFVFSAVFLGLIGKDEEPVVRDATSHVAREIADGARALLDDQRLLALALAAGVNAIGQGIFGTLYALFFINELGFQPGPLGLIYATGGAASFIGAALSVRTADRIGAQRAMVLGLAGWGAAYLLITLAHGAGASSIALLVGQQLLGDFAGTIYFVTHLTLLQKIAPPAMLGRVVGSIRFVHRGATLIGAGLGALLGNAIGLRDAIGIGALMFIVSAVIIAAFRFEGATDASA